MEKGITKLSVSGFKSIAKETMLDIKPLTLLAGANSSGKSSFMQPLLLLKQTLESSHDPGLPLTLNGKSVKFTSVDQLFTKEGKCSLQSFSIGLYSARNSHKTVFGGNKPAKRLTVESVDFTEFPGRKQITIRADMTKEEMLNTIQNSWMFGRRNGVRCADGSEKKISKNNLHVDRNRFFLEIINKHSEKYSSSLISSQNFGIIEYVSMAIHIPGLRGNPERMYQTTGIGPNFPGTFEHYTASVISHWGEQKSDKLKQLCSHLTHLGLTSKVSATRQNDAQIEVQVGRLLKNGQSKSDMVNIADVGFGVSQTLPVLVALLVAEPGQLVYLEQPEIHLHPRAQMKLANILVEAANRGVKVVAETHSSLLLLAVQTLIAKKIINKDNVALHWFERDKKTGLTETSTAELDEAGCFGEWPVDFGDVELKAESDFIEAAALAQKDRKTHG